MLTRKEWWEVNKTEMSNSGLSNCVIYDYCFDKNEVSEIEFCETFLEMEYLKSEYGVNWFV